LLFLTLLTALLACLAAFVIALSMGIHGNLIWIVTESLRLILVAAPWIGVSMFVQSLLTGRLDTTAETLIAALVASVLAFVTNWGLGFGKLAILPEPAFSDPWHWYVDLAAREMAQFSLISTALVTYAIGFAGMLLAVRRFNRMDF
jgi:hypothetical protein